MPKWKSGATKYTISVSICWNRGYQSTTPMPLIDVLGRPDQITSHVRGAGSSSRLGRKGHPFAPPRRAVRGPPGRQPPAADCPGISTADCTQPPSHTAPSRGRLARYPLAGTAALSSAPALPLPRCPPCPHRALARPGECLASERREVPPPPLRTRAPSCAPSA